MAQRPKKEAVSIKKKIALQPVHVHVGIPRLLTAFIDDGREKEGPADACSVGSFIAFPRHPLFVTSAGIFGLWANDNFDVGRKRANPPAAAVALRSATHCGK